MRICQLRQTLRSMCISTGVFRTTAVISKLHFNFVSNTFLPVSGLIAIFDFPHHFNTRAAWPCGWGMQLLRDRAGFDPEPRHAPASRGTRMLNMRLDWFGKNHWLNMPCPTGGKNIHSERSGAHDCIEGEGRLSLGIWLWSNVCIPTA